MANLEISRAERLDQHVVAQLPHLSRSSVSKLIESGKISVNGAVVTKNGYKLRPDDTVNVDYSEADYPVAPVVELEVLYEDKSCVVVNKPTGLLTHSKGAFNPEPTVATWLSNRVKGMNGERAGIVHRLDRATSGVMICAKTPEALSWLQKQFALRNTKKIYAAVVSGAPAKPEAVIDMPIERNPKKPQTFRVGANGKAAVTAYKVIKSGEKYSLLTLRPTTGRTHQLRVHLQKVGCPIVGDVLYGGRSADRLYLHAESLELTLPNKSRQIFRVAVPPEFEKCLRG